MLILINLAVTNSSHADLSYYGDESDGFLWGLWHGAISCMKLPCSVLFPDKFSVYNTNNNGFMYNLGFFIIAVSVSEITIPLLIIAWVFRGIFWLVVLMITASSGRLKH